MESLLPHSSPWEVSQAEKSFSFVLFCSLSLNLCRDFRGGLDSSEKDDIITESLRLIQTQDIVSYVAHV